MKAAEKGYVNIAKALLEAKAKIEIHNKDGCCALIRAANHGHEEIVRLLLNNGADINIKSHNGNTGLFYSTNKIRLTFILNVYVKYLQR
jgi:ankyrin repeat protein